MHIIVIGRPVPATASRGKWTAAHDEHAWSTVSGTGREGNSRAQVSLMTTWPEKHKGGFGTECFLPKCVASCLSRPKRASVQKTASNGSCKLQANGPQQSTFVKFWYSQAGTGTYGTRCLCVRCARLPLCTVQFGVLRHSFSLFH